MPLVGFEPTISAGERREAARLLRHKNGTWKASVADICCLLLQNRHVIFPYIEDSQSALALL